MKILFIGDVYGKLGREALQKYLPQIKQEHKPNLIFINGENAAHGRGITPKIYKEFQNLGASLITMGNHTYGNQKIYELFDEDANIIRPANFGNVPGKGYKTIKYNDKLITVVNLIGRTFMSMQSDNPFKVMDDILEKVKDSDYIFVDFHGEATSEKVAFAHNFDGLVTAVVGTHTHVPTADNRRLENGTYYITDLGMTGAVNGVIGVEKDIVIKRFREGYSSRNEPSKDQRLQLNGVIIDLLTKKIERINIFEK